MTNDETEELMVLLALSGRKIRLPDNDQYLSKRSGFWKVEDQRISWYECAAMVKKMLLDYKREPDGSLSLEKNVED